MKTYSDTPLSPPDSSDISRLLPPCESPAQPSSQDSRAHAAGEPEDQTKHKGNHTQELLGRKTAHSIYGILSGRHNWKIFFFLIPEKLI